MITFEPFTETRKRTGISTYQLITKYNISSSTVNRIRNNLPISTITLNHLCEIYQCRVEDIVKYVPDSKKDTSNYMK